MHGMQGTRMRGFETDGWMDGCRKDVWIHSPWKDDKWMGGLSAEIWIAQARTKGTRMRVLRLWTGTKMDSDPGKVPKDRHASANPSTFHPDVTWTHRQPPVLGFVDPTMLPRLPSSCCTRALCAAHLAECFH